MSGFFRGLRNFSPVEFSTPLGVAAWTILALVPLAILALYFLKLRRRPVVIPSTLLWKRSLEDLHVNSLFQRLRRNLLLFLQLLAAGLAILALAGPRVKGTATQGQRYVIAIDNSASMSATDVAPSRLARAKADAIKLVEGMASDDLAMVIAFSDRARVVSNYTSNRQLLRQRIESIGPTQSGTSLLEALQVAAGLANPSSDVFARNLPQGVIATNAMIPPKLMIYTDGGFPDVEGFSVGNLQPHVFVIGPAPPPVAATPEAGKSGQTAPAAGSSSPSNNVAVLALQAGRNEEKPDQFEVFGRVRNYRAQQVETEARLYRMESGGDGTLVDAVALTIAPQSDQAFKFDLPDRGAAEFEVRLKVEDALPMDDRAYVVFGNERRAQILLISRGNRYLADTLRTTVAQELAEVSTATPEEFETDADLKRDLSAGRYDLVLFDRVRPQEPPEANTLYFGALPPGEAFDAFREVQNPIILDWNIAHPLMQYIRDLGLVRVAKATTGELPPGATPLIEAGGGPIAFTMPRGGFLDVVVTFAIFDGDNFNTDWPVRYSFPLFLYNAIRVLGNAGDTASEEQHRPGQAVALRADAATESVVVTSPDGRSETLTRSSRGTFDYNQADRVGIYRARWGESGAQSFAVNLFDPRESDLSTRGLAPEGTPPSEADRYQIKIGYTAVQGTRRSTPAIQEWWRYLAVAMLGVLLLEWYIYNRRVYI